MKKLYARLLAIILCGTIPVILVAREGEETRFVGDAERLRGLFVGLEKAPGRVKKMSLRNFLVNLGSKFEDKECLYNLGECLFFVSGLVDLPEKVGKEIKKKACLFYNGHKDMARCDNVIRVLKSLRNGENYQKVQEEFIDFELNSSKETIKKCLLFVKLQ